MFFFIILSPVLQPYKINYPNPLGRLAFCLKPPSKMPCVSFMQELMLLLNLPIVWNKTKKKVTGCDEVNLGEVSVMYWPFMTSQEASTHSEWVEQAKKN